MHCCLGLRVFLHLTDEMVYLPLRKVADTPFNVQGEDLLKMGVVNIVLK